MQSEKQIIHALKQFLEEGKRIEQTKHNGGLYETIEIVDKSLFIAWRNKVLTYIRNIKLEIPDIISCIEGATKEYYTTYQLVKNSIQSLIDLLESQNIPYNESEKYDLNHELEVLFRRFHKVARQLRTRHANRETLDIKDEYDVQDLLHALLYLCFDDVRAEEWTPSYAGGAVRADFLLKESKTFIEVKKTRSSLTTKELGEELIIDCEKYKTHPDCEKLYCFIYDP